MLPAVKAVAEGSRFTTEPMVRSLMTCATTPGGSRMPVTAGPVPDAVSPAARVSMLLDSARARDSHTCPSASRRYETVLVAGVPVSSTRQDRRRPAASGVEDGYDSCVAAGPGDDAPPPPAAGLALALGLGGALGSMLGAMDADVDAVAVPVAVPDAVPLLVAVFEPVPVPLADGIMEALTVAVIEAVRLLLRVLDAVRVLLALPVFEPVMDGEGVMDGLAPKDREAVGVLVQLGVCEAVCVPVGVSLLVPLAVELMDGGAGDTDAVPLALAGMDGEGVLLEVPVPVGDALGMPTGVAVAVSEDVAAAGGVELGDGAAGRSSSCRLIL